MAGRDVLVLTGHCFSVVDVATVRAHEPSSSESLPAMNALKRIGSSVSSSAITGEPAVLAVSAWIRAGLIIHRPSAPFLLFLCFLLFLLFFSFLCFFFFFFLSVSSSSSSSSLSEIAASFLRFAAGFP